MAKRKSKRDGSKSAAVRDYIAKNPNAKPKEIYEALTKQGLKLSLALVNAVKYKTAKSTKRPGRPKRKAAAPKSSTTLSAAELIEAKKLVDSLGGIEKTREALELLDKLT